MVVARARARRDVSAIPEIPDRGDHGGSADLASRLQGVDAALRAVEAPTGDLREDVRAELVAKLAADRYLCFKHADLAKRAMMIECWSRRRGQMIHVAESSGSNAVPTSA
jgi:hypothetical protein